MIGIIEIKNIQKRLVGISARDEKGMIALAHEIRNQYNLEPIDEFSIIQLFGKKKPGSKEFAFRAVLVKEFIAKNHEMTFKSNLFVIGALGNSFYDSEEKVYCNKLINGIISGFNFPEDSKKALELLVVLSKLSNSRIYFDAEQEIIAKMGA